MAEGGGPGQRGGGMIYTCKSALAMSHVRLASMGGLITTW